MNIVKLLLLVLWLFGCTGGYKQFVMRGEVHGIKYGKAFIINPANDSVLLSAKLDKGQFKFENNHFVPGLYIIQVNQWKDEFLLSGCDLKIALDYYSSRASLKGSPENDLLFEYQKMIQDKVYSDKGEKYPSNREMTEEEKDEALSRSLRKNVLRVEYTRDFVKEHPDNLVSAYVANRMKGTDYDAGLEMYNLLSRDVKNSALGKLLKKEVDELEISGYGKPLPAIQVENMRGEKVVLENLKGAITVVDFWASWCGPCRQEMQYLKKLYKSLEGKNVKFVSVSMDDNSTKWLKACEQERIPWESVRNLDGYNKNVGICKLMSIRFIPFIVVLDPDGKIVGKDLQRNNLRNKLLELLEK